MELELHGCGCTGFSLTDKYIDSIIRIYEIVGKIKHQTYEYKIFQNIISEKESDKSEIRMIIPFFRKAKIISSTAYVLNGDKINSLTVDKDFFTNIGHIFVKILKIKRDSSSFNNVSSIIQNMYKNMGLLIFNNLRHSEKDNTFNPYSQIYNYLLNNDTMNKYEFYILTTYYTDINKQNKILNQYHSGDISDSDITIKQNINDWNYLTPLLEQLSIITKNNDRTISLTDIAKKRVKNV